MVMQVALVAAAAASGTPTFTQDFTDSGVFGGATPKLAIFLSATSGSADSATDGAQFNLGAVAGASYGAISFAADTASATSNTGRSERANAAYIQTDNTGAVVGVATASLIADGARLSWTDQSAGETIYALLLGGDIEASVVNFTMPGGTGDKTVTHNLSAAPEVIIAFGVQVSADNSDGGGTAGPHIGFWCGAGQAGYGHRIPDAVTTSALSGRMSTTQAVVSMGGSSPVYSGTIGSVGATTFVVNVDASSTQRLHFICLRSTSGTALAAKAGTFTAKTSTGTQQDVSGMSLDPQIMLVLPTALTSADANSTSDTAGNFGLGIACVNSSTLSTQYASVQHGSDDGVATTNDWMNHQHSAAKHLHQLDTAGATAVAATISSWSGGVLHNYGTASGTAVQNAYLAFGADVSSSGNAPRARFYEMLRAQ